MTTAQIIQEHERLMEANRILAERLAKSYGWLLSHEQKMKVEEQKS